MTHFCTSFCENDIEERRTVILWNVNSGFSDGNNDFGVQLWKWYLFLSGIDQSDFRCVGGKNERLCAELKKRQEMNVI